MQIRARRCKSVEVEPLTIRTGAVVHGVDLSDDLSDEVIAAIRAAVLRHRVIFFRGQHLSGERHLSFASRFGPRSPPVIPRCPPRPGNPRSWSWIRSPGAGPTVGTPTTPSPTGPPPFRSCAAWSSPAAGVTRSGPTPSPPTSTYPSPCASWPTRFARVHTNAPDVASSVEFADEAARLHEEEFTSTIFETEHPVVRVHPETGERALLLGGFAQRIVGLSGEESRAVIGMLQDRVPTPENTVRWHWTEGDVAMWDNRSTQHYAVNDYGDIHRVVKRVTVAGAVPVGIDGRPSIALRGDASAYSVVGAY